MKQTIDAWKITRYCLLACAIALSLLGPKIGLSNRLAVPFLFAAFATIFGSDGYASEKPASERSIDKASFWVAIAAALANLPFVLSDA